jgi:hypothetical protein
MFPAIIERPSAASAPPALSIESGFLICPELPFVGKAAQDQVKADPDHISTILITYKIHL